MVMVPQATVDTDEVQIAKPFVNGRELELVREVLESGRLSLGPMVVRFEQAFAEAVGTKHAVAVSSGTTGLHVAAITAGWGPGDEVITSPFSFVASANIARMTGATVQFADVDPDTFNLDPAAVEAAITPRTRGLVPVHIFGYPADMPAFNRIAAERDLTIVEDTCEALGATFEDGTQVGTSGNPAVFGFYPNKQMTTGEGGMLVTDDDQLADDWRSLINQGRSDSGAWLEHDRLGYNYRLSDVASAIGVAQLEKLPRMLAMRDEVAREYTRHFAGMEGVTTPFEGPCTRSWFVYWVLLDEGIDRNAVMAKMGERGVQTKPYLPSIHLQPAYRELGFEPGMFPVSESISARSLALPFYAQLGPSNQARVIETLGEVLDSMR
jgi:perosamine synthetase